MAIEIVDFPINSMVIFHSYVKLPEGIITSRLYPPLWLVTFNRYRAESQWRGTARLRAVSPSEMTQH
jgi:hypothetical protein